MKRELGWSLPFRAISSILPTPISETFKYSLLTSLLLIFFCGCANKTALLTSPAAYSGKWEAVGREYQDYYFEIVLVRGEPRLASEPEARFKSNTDKAKYQSKYGEIVRIADAFSEAVESLEEIAEIGGPVTSEGQEIVQKWTPYNRELVWQKRHYQATNGLRDQEPFHTEEYKFHFKSSSKGTMTYDNKQFRLNRLPSSRLNPHPI